MTPSSLDPLVSVVLPTHDRPKRLLGALKSVLSQTHRHLEVVLVDDGSAVSVDQVLGSSTLDDPRITLVRLEESRGPGGARNVGVANASGGMIAFLDDDDRWEPTKLARQIAYLAEHSDVGLASCQHFVVREDGPSRCRVFRGPDSYTAAQLLWVNFVGSFSFVMVRRDHVEDELQIDESFRCAEDWDLWLRCARRCRIGVLPEPLVRYVFHNEPRLTETETKRGGLQHFERKHGADMSESCRIFHRAHQQMDTGTGWGKRLQVARALVTPSPPVTVLLAREQLARQLGRLWGDPGLAERTLARLIPS